MAAAQLVIQTLRTRTVGGGVCRCVSVFLLLLSCYLVGRQKQLEKVQS